MAKYIRTEEGYKTITDIDGIATSEQVNHKMNAADPEGFGSFSMGRKFNSIIGDNSHAEGFNTTASGPYSHAEGLNTTASGPHSHAEGRDTTASNISSHAEGYQTTASGVAAHTEGLNTTAFGPYSHAEGWDTTASDAAAHTEGFKTTAFGIYSHAEGNITIAESQSQHVQGEYNIIDTEGTPTTRGKYAHIVGNGTAEDACSNAHTLDWQGNAWYQGDVYVGSTSGTNKDEGSKKLATEEYVNTSVASVVNSAPETLNTLNELAAALGNDENFATTVAIQIGTKVDKIDGKGLSSNDYDSETKTFVDTLKTKNLATQEIVDLHLTDVNNPHIVTKAQVGLSNVDNVKQYSETNPPPYPVTSVNGQTGAVSFTTEEWTFTLSDGSTVTKRVMLG